MVVAVWGATGFIGRHIVNALIDGGETVRALCRNTAGLSVEGKGKLESFALPFEASLHDFKTALKGVDCVIHCAGVPGVDPVNLALYESGTASLVEAARATGVRRVILLSTVAVYGNRWCGQIDTTTLPSPGSPYGESRLRAEILSREQITGSPTELIIVRVPTVIGIGMPGKVLERFFGALRFGLFLHPGDRASTLSCIGVHRLASHLSEIVRLPAGRVPAVCQFSDNLEWTTLVARYEATTGRHVLRLPVPSRPTAKLLSSLEGTSFAGPIRVLGSLAQYSDDATRLGLDSREPMSLLQEVDAILSSRTARLWQRRELAAGPGAGTCSCQMDWQPVRLMTFLWIAYFAYATMAALIFQKLLLPMMPGLHGGHGLLAADSIRIHDVAIRLASAMRESGWEAWSPWPSAPAFTGNVAVLGVLYYFFGPDPALVIPLNAALHATSALLLIHLARTVVSGKPGLYGGILAATLFVAFPSSLNWYGQVYKDGYAILGFLLFSLGLLAGLSGRTKQAIPTIAAGIALSVFVRPNNLMLLLCAAILVPIVAAATRNLRGLIGGLMIVAAIIATKSMVPSLESQTLLDVRSMESSLQGTLPPRLRDWHWRESTWLPRALDQQLALATALRVRYLAHGILGGAGSMVDTDQLPESAGEVVLYLPRALQLALFAPFPSQWLKQSSATRLVGVAETAVWYLLLPGLVFALARMRSASLLLLAGTALCVMTIESYITPNLGTLHRIRYPFLFLLATIGAIGWMAWLPSTGRRKCNVDGQISGGGEATSERRRLLVVSIGVVSLTAIGFLGLFVRDLLMAHEFGLGHELDAFQLALVLPILFINLFALPINAFAVPVFLRLRAQGKETAQFWMGDMLWRLLVIFSAFAALIGIGGYLLSHRLGGGNVLSRAWEMGIWLLPVVALSGATVFGNAVLNALGRAAYAAAAQTTVPAAAIASLLVFGDRYGATSVAAAMAAGQLLNLALLAAAIRRSGYSVVPRRHRLVAEPGRRYQYLVLVAASLISSAALPIGIAMAAHAAVGDAASLALGNKVVQFATGISTAVLVAVLLPYFSRLIAHNRAAEAKRDLVFAQIAATLLASPIALLIVFFAQDIAHVIFSGGRMGEVEVSHIAQVLRMTILQLPFFVATTVFVKFAIATQRVTWILLAAVIGQIVNVGCSAFLMSRFGAAGIALGMSVGAMTSATVMLLWFWHRRNLDLLSVCLLVTTWLLFSALAVCILFESTVGLVIGAIAFSVLIVGELPRWRDGKVAHAIGG